MSPGVQRFDDATLLPEPPRPSALVIGNFDGVHRGHAMVLREAATLAKARGLVPAVLTFDPHPAAVVGNGAPALLTTVERRAQLIAEQGMAATWVRAFDRAFAAWDPDRFARDLVARGLGARLVVVGQNFRFGARRAGDLARLRDLGAALGFEVVVHAIASDERGPYSSTRAREAIAAGNLAEATHVLGRAHELSGVVVRGDQRGRTIGFPTANLGAVAEMLPPDGVYAVRVERLAEDGTAAPLAGGVTNVGVRPTVSGGARTVETFLFDFEGDLYGAPLRLRLVDRLREERRFSGLPELKAQIARDCESARERLAAP